MKLFWNEMWELQVRNMGFMKRHWKAYLICYVVYVMILVAWLLVDWRELTERVKRFFSKVFKRNEKTTDLEEA